jgi:hypothetical protein
MSIYMMALFLHVSGARGVEFQNVQCVSAAVLLVEGKQATSCGGNE